jgi:hypothetical protein
VAPVTTPLIYVGGSARSGSTLLERLLSGIPGFCSVGELVFVWDRGLRRNDRCGCGVPFRNCPFWTDVGAAAFGGWSQLDVDEAVRLRAVIDRHRNLDRLAGLRRPGKLAADLTAYMTLTDQLYRAVRLVSGASVIVDSSKHASYALLLRRLPAFDLRLVHLVRRSHGVAYSWSKRVRKPGVGDGSSLMTVIPPRRAVTYWVADNLLFEALARRVPSSTRVRYEDLVADPQANLRKILCNLYLTPTDQELGFLTAAAAELPVTHAFSGNPGFQPGPLALRPADDDWRAAMSVSQRAMISAVTWPLLARYGYAHAASQRPRP